VGGSVSKNRLVNEKVGGVDDPTARWSLPAGSDKGCSPLTSTAFFEKKAAQKSFYTRVRLNERYLLMNDDTQ
jgi:hypothetical protein